MTREIPFNTQGIYGGFFYLKKYDLKDADFVFLV
jgi:hypothetical protein